MDTDTLIQTLQNAPPRVTGSCYIVNGALVSPTEAQNTNYDGFSMRVRMNILLELYKYFPNRLAESVDKKTGKPIIDETAGDEKT